MQVPNLLFLAVSPEEKESWINALNVAVTRAKNRSFDEVGPPSFDVLNLPRFIVYDALSFHEDLDAK